MIYHLFFYLIWKVVKKYKTFFWESGVWYNLSGSVDNNDMQFFHKSEHFLAKMPSFAIPVPAKRMSNQQQQTVTNDVLREYQQQKNYKIDDTPKNDHCLMINNLQAKINEQQPIAKLNSNSEEQECAQSKYALEPVYYQNPNTIKIPHLESPTEHRDGIRISNRRVQIFKKCEIFTYCHFRIWCILALF